MATTRGTACPRRVSADKTRQGKFKMFLWAQQDINTALLAGTCGLDPRGLSHRLAVGLESAAGRRAWVSGNPAGLSQRRAGVSRGRRRHLPRMAGVISRERWARWVADGGVNSREWRGWESRGRRRISPTIGGPEGSRPADSRWSRRTPTPRWHGLGRKDEWRLPCRGTDKHRNKKKTYKNEKTKRCEGAPLTVRSGLLSRCTHEEDTGTRRRGVNSK